MSGTGNCLFASLSDQLYGAPSRHGEIRATVIEHMRTFRPLYEDFVHANDVIQKRATRATTESIRKQMEDDAFEGYLVAMSRNGTYGGQPELLSFVRSYDQDVMVHLPPSMGWDTLTISYKNEHREPGVEARPALHICYGGDEERNAHYDSSQKSEAENHNRALTSRPKTQAHPRRDSPASQQSDALSSRAMRNMKSDPSKDMMHELVTRGGKELKSSLDILNDQRARSPSVTSSHYSTSSKRSFEDDGDQPRSAKRTDRKKRSLRSRAAARQLSTSPGLSNPMAISHPTSSGPPTPTSSQDSDSSSDNVSGTRKGAFESTESSPPEVIDLVDDDSDYHEEGYSSGMQKTSSHGKLNPSYTQEVVSSVSSIVTESSHSALQT